jgi:hypothetical protein
VVNCLYPFPGFSILGLEVFRGRWVSFWRKLMRYFLFVIAALSMLGTGIVPANACPAGTHPVCSYNGGAHSTRHCE